MLDYLNVIPSRGAFFYWSKMITRIHNNLPKELTECCECHLALPLSEFCKRKSKKNGTNSRCRICHSGQRKSWDQEAVKASGKRWRERTGYKQKSKPRPYSKQTYAYNIKQKYGISIEERDVIAAKQGHKCAICGVPEMELNSSLAIDHCHQTGTVRGLLCKQCNLGVGNMKDDVNILKNAIVYLTRT